MSWRDVIAFAARGVGRRPGRAVLTVVAVALAAGLFSALVAVSRTAEARVLDDLANGGPLAGIEVAAAEPDPAQMDRDDAEPGEPRDLDAEALARIARLPDVETVVPVVATPVVVVPPEPLVLADGTRATLADSWDGRDDRDGDRGPRGVLFETLVGADMARAADLPITVLAGRLPGPGSLAEVAVTPGWLARFGLERDDAPLMVGVEVEIGALRSFDEAIRGRWSRAEIVGVVTQDAAAGLLVAPVEAVGVARAWTLAGGPADDRFTPSSSPYSGAFVVARGLDDVADVRQAIHDLGYATSAPENLIAGVRRYLRVVEIVLGAIGLIALAVAAMGIANALLAAVRERRREIGVLKAIGARDRDVLRLFLVEAGLLGLTGGLAGTLVGLALASLVARAINTYLHSEGLAGIQPQIPLGAAALAVVGAGLLAVAAGGIPARRAARLSAREAIET